jgi:uncharacterized DUF497 family protein
MEFEWDQSKAASNLRKHRVSFEDAASTETHKYRNMKRHFFHMAALLVVAYE